MIIIDFSELGGSLSQCPIWWQNFVVHTCENLSALESRARTDALVAGLKKYNAIMIDSSDYTEDIDEIRFETEEDFLAFKLRWM